MSRAIFKMRGTPSVIKIVGEVAGNTSPVNTSVHNLGNIDVGPLATVKHCIMGITTSDGSTNILTGFTVGGISFLPFINQGKSGGTPDLICWGLIGDISALSGNQQIIATFNGSVRNAAVSGVAVTGLESTTPVVETDAGTNGGLTLVLLNLEVEKDGIILAVECHESENTNSSWSSMTEKADVEVANQHRHTSAWDLGSRSLFSETITAGGNGRSTLAMSFR